MSNDTTKPMPDWVSRASISILARAAREECTEAVPTIGTVLFAFFLAECFEPEEWENALTVLVANVLEGARKKRAGEFD